MSRSRLAEYGIRKSGARAIVVRVTQRGVTRTVVEWREGPRRLTQSFADTPEGRRLAKQYAQGVVDRLGSQRVAKERLTLTQLFDRYVLAHTDAWREKTRVNEIRRWRYFAETVGPHTFADLITEDTMDEVRRSLRGLRSVRAPKGIAPAQVAAILSNVKRVFAFAHKRKHVEHNAIAGYEIRKAKDERPMNVAEFPPEEAAQVIARFSATDSRRWRAWVVCTLAANQGTRVAAILKAHDADYDLTGTPRTVTWRAETDKLGRQRIQPLTRDAVHAVRVARVWRRRMGYTGKYLVPAVRQARRAQDLPWTYSALHALVMEAEREAGVPHRPYRALHGFRRMAGGNVLDATGDINAVGEWLGDTDLRVLKRSYLKPRPDRLAAIAAKLSTPRRNPDADVALASTRRADSQPEA